MEKEAQQKAIEEILTYYRNHANPGSQDNLVTMLRELQEVYGCIPVDLQQAAADAAGVKLSSVTCLMKLYKSLKPAAYRHKITVCTGPRCAAKNSGILEAVKQELHIGENGISADGVFFVDTGGCLKQCRSAPNVMIDGTLFPNMTAKEMIHILRGLK